MYRCDGAAVMVCKVACTLCDTALVAQVAWSGCRFVTVTEQADIALQVKSACRAYKSIITRYKKHSKNTMLGILAGHSDSLGAPDVR